VRRVSPGAMCFRGPYRPWLCWTSRGDRMTEPSTGWQLDAITYSGGTQDGPRANVKLSWAGEQVHAEGSGTGLIEAVCHSISQATGVEARVVAFRAYSLGPGSELRSCSRGCLLLGCYGSGPRLGTYFVGRLRSPAWWRCSPRIGTLRARSQMSARYESACGSPRRSHSRPSRRSAPRSPLSPSWMMENYRIRPIPAWPISRRASPEGGGRRCFSS